MEDFTLRVFTEYGPLAAGWGVAFLLWRRLIVVHDAKNAELTALVREGFAHMSAMNTLLASIKDILARTTP